MIESELLSVRIYLVKVTLKIAQEKYLLLKTNPWTYKAKDSNKRKNNDYYEKEFLLSKLKMSFYPEPDSNLRDKFKVVLDLSNYVTENN